MTDDEGLGFLATPLDDIYKDNDCVDLCAYSGTFECPPLREQVAQMVRAERKGREPKSTPIKQCKHFKDFRDEVDRMEGVS